MVPPADQAGKKLIVVQLTKHLFPVIVGIVDIRMIHDGVSDYENGFKCHLPLYKPLVR